MASKRVEISEADAQSLMSQLIDGEISPEDADSLHAYLDSHPEAMQWMESTSLIGEQAGHGTVSTDLESAWHDISEEIRGDAVKSVNSKNLLTFPMWLKGIGIAAALVITASLVWIAGPQSDSEVTERYAASESVVEFVETEIPDASPIVYTDERSGWTVVWVTEMEPISDETG